MLDGILHRTNQCDFFSCASVFEVGMMKNTMLVR
jgi:hypothetical protein